VRLAVIDCGTNTFNLLIVDTPERGKYHKVFNTRLPVKLGEGAINEGFIAEVPFNRGISALKKFRQYVDNHNVDQLLVFGTSAIRDARNGNDFVREVRDQLDINIEVIDGDREAELIYLGNREALQMTDDISLIMDIGGGSTEFILADNCTVYWKQSYNLGAARLLDKFDPSSPVTEDEVAAMRNYLKVNLSPLFGKVLEFKPVELIGSSGAFDSVVEMIHGELGGEPLTKEKTGYDINIGDYNRISTLVKCSTLEERKNIKGLAPMRFDMIVISCIMIDFVLEELKLNKMRVSVYSLKEGALLDFFGKQA